jgi:hypothetical protein
MSLALRDVIQEKNHNQQEIRHRWLRVINTRLTEDKITASMIKQNKGFTNLVVKHPVNVHV